MMSLFKFGITSNKMNGAGVKQKIGKDSKYDGKRQRNFRSEWKKRYEWLRFDDHDGSMFCLYCREFPELADTESAMFRGTKDLKVDPIKRHQPTSEHVGAIRMYLKKFDPQALPGANVPNTVFGRAVLKQHLSQNQMAIYKHLFNTAYAVCKHGKPFADFELMCSLQNKNGLDVGKNYHNVMGCKLFMNQIAASLQKSNAEQIKASPFVSIMADGRTDCAVIEQEIVYLRYIYNNKPVTEMCSVELLENARADGVLSAIVHALEKVDLSLDVLKFDHGSSNQCSKPVLVGVSFDGASINFGKKNGVVKKLKDTFPDVIGIHCVAHKLELAILDAIKQSSYMPQFEETIKGIYSFYHFSPKRRREIAEIAEILEEDLIHFSSIKQIRWLSSKSRAIAAVEGNLSVVVKHLKHGATTGTLADDANREKGYHDHITSVPFLKHLYFMLDFLPILGKLSKVFQQDELLVVELPEAIEEATASLLNLKSHPGKHVKLFQDKLNCREKMFGDIKLNTKSKPRSRGAASESQDPTCDFTVFYGLVDDAVTYINTRFHDFKTKPLSLFSCLDFHTWPLQKQDLMSFGNEDLLLLVRDSFHGLLTEDEIGNLEDEWIEWKLYASRFYKSSPLLPIYSLMLDIKVVAVPGSPLSSRGPLSKIVQLMMTLSPSTSMCERGFSKMNLLKTAA